MTVMRSRRRVQYPKRTVTSKRIFNTLTRSTDPLTIKGDMDFPAYPLIFTPIYKDYLWGGDRIAVTFDRGGVPPVCAESWEVSAHADGLSRVSEGPLAGASLDELTRRYGAALLGTHAPDPGRFPLLFKLIHARERLSLQVHPNAVTAPRRNGEPKTEMWLVLDCDPDASLYVGLKPGVGPDDLRRALDAKQVEGCLNAFRVRPGDAILIPGGQVHAIGAGCLIYEVQQSSNTTYRLTDWDRLGTDGLPRPLHVAEAFDVIAWDLPVPSLCHEAPSAPPTDARLAAASNPPLRSSGAASPNVWAEVLTCPFFRMRRLHLEQTENLVSDGGSFQTLFVRSGMVSATVGDLTVEIPHGSSCLLPAAASCCKLEPHGTANLLLTTLPL